MKHPLASANGIELVLATLMAMGAMCPKCGFATRVVNKQWSKCGRCVERVARRELPKGERLRETS